jgi:hypothetical protein
MEADVIGAVGLYRIPFFQTPHECPKAYISTLIKACLLMRFVNLKCHCKPPNVHLVNVWWLDMYDLTRRSINCYYAS